jgi:transcriptional regulator with XRE-family HTH domain
MRVIRSYAVPCDAERIRALRGERTQTEIAKLANVSLGVVVIAESDGGRVTIRILERLAFVLGVSVEEIRARPSAPTVRTVDAGLVMPGQPGPAPRELRAQLLDWQTRRRLPLEAITSLGLGSSLSIAATNDSTGFDDL